jgi:putative endonuclease
MVADKLYFVYIMTNAKHTVLYTGFSSDLKVRVWSHKERLVDGFIKKYHIDMLVYYEATESVVSALERERQIKAGSRQNKINLINSMNPEWRDLYDDLDTFVCLRRTQYDIAMSDCRYLRESFGKVSQRKQEVFNL